MTKAPDNMAKRRADAYFTASFEVARRLADGRGEQAIAVLQQELERTREAEDQVTGRRFLLSQIALCHARMGDTVRAREILQEIETNFAHDAETALMLAEGYLLLLEDGERSSHHAALALQLAENEGPESPKMISRAQNLLARALLAEGDLTGAFGAWQSGELPEWRVATDLIEAGFEPPRVREVLAECLPRHEAQERTLGLHGVAATDQIRRLIGWIDAGCPRKTKNHA